MESVLMLPGEEFKDLVQCMKDAVTALHNKGKTSEPEFVGNDEFMRLMGISKRTAQSWRDQGVIAFSQVGGKIYYQIADIAKLLQEHRHGRYGEDDKKKGGKP